MATQFERLMAGSARQSDRYDALSSSLPPTTEKVGVGPNSGLVLASTVTSHRGQYLGVLSMIETLTSTRRLLSVEGPPKPRLTHSSVVGTDMSH